MHSSAIAGACAGLVSSVVTCPLDVVKTRLQAQEGRSSARPQQPSPSALRSLPPHAALVRGDIAAEQNAKYLGLSGTLRKIWRDDGIRGFYRGLGPTIFGYLPTWAIYFTVYDTSKQTLARDIGHSGEEDFLNHILSALTAGAISTVCTSPLWVVKTRFMLQSVKDKSVKPYRHTGDAFVQIYKSEGLRGFYKGLLPSLFGVSHVAVQFPLYESFKSLARERLNSDELQPSTILLCSSSAKMIASVTTYPHEVLRTRLQMQPRNKEPPAPAQQSSSGRSAPPIGDSNSQTTATNQSVAQSSRNGRYSGVIQACKIIARDEGIRGFYKGMTVNLVRTVPSSALTILTYEVIMQHLAQIEHEQQAAHTSPSQDTSTS